jgi:hypothetical protein
MSPAVRAPAVCCGSNISSKEHSIIVTGQAEGRKGEFVLQLARAAAGSPAWPLRPFTQARWAHATVTTNHSHPRCRKPAPAWSSSVASNTQGRLRGWRVGQPLCNQNIHTGDLSIVATVVRRGLVLVSDDAVFDGCPDLQVIGSPA